VENALRCKRHRGKRLLLVVVDKIDRFLSDSSGEVAFFFDGFEATNSGEVYF
jgi:hypothetical protein